MQIYDTIVVGAGPAGATTAYRIAEAGGSVLLLDRAFFPRDKPCGGGVTGRAARLLPFPIDAVIEDEVSCVELRLGYGRSVERAGAKPLVFMTQRRRLDQFLVEQAVAVGAEFRDGTKVTEIEQGEEGVLVRTRNEEYRGSTIIGADGVNGVASRMLGLGGNRTVGVAVEGNVSHDRIDAERYRHRLFLELGTVPGGYGWVFPKGDHVNVGVGGWGKQAPNLRVALNELCAAHGLSREDLEDVRGHRLPLREPTSVLARGKAAVVGDAAGLVDPVTGDGMFEGFLSATFAAEAIADFLQGRARSLAPYSERLTDHLGAHLWASWGVKAALDRFPRTAFTIARSKLVWGATEKLIQGEVEDITTIRGAARPPLKALAFLARLAGDPGREYRAV